MRGGGGKPNLLEYYDAMKRLAGDAWDSMNTLQKASLATTPLPVVPDVLGLIGDAQMYYEQPKERTMLNYGLSGLGLLPLVPSVGGTMKMGKIAHRYTRGDVPVNRSGYMLFADDVEKVANNYGKNHWVADVSDLPTVGQIKEKIRNFFNSRADILDEYQVTAKELAESFDPDDIVNSAGGWDNEDLVSEIYTNILEPEGIIGVKVNDGAVLFDNRNVKMIDGGN